MGAKKRNNTSSRKRPRSDGGSDSKASSGSANNTDVSNRVSPAAHTQLWYGGAVLTIAIVAGVIWNQFDSTDGRVLRFWSQACRVATCARFVTTTRRTIQAGRPIRAGEILVEIPRDLQIWDLDALRNDFVREQLFSARHGKTQNRLPSGSFLAAYLALLSHQRDVVSSNSSSTLLESDDSLSLSSVHEAYFDALPTNDEVQDHPLFWSRTDLSNEFHPISQTLGVVGAYHDMVASEYQSFATVSSEFAARVSASQYRLARLHVLTRSFSPGPVGRDELSEDEKQLYQQNVENDFDKGCHAMVPILDMLNHHPNPNVAYNYNKDKRAFVITAKTAIPAAFEVYDSYGRFTDSHLFAKFGFVNGDGSGHTQASIAIFHRMMDFQMGHEFSHLPKASASMPPNQQDLRRYLQFDDGYVDCISGPEEAESDAWKLKELKLQHLHKIANKASNWIVTVGPRNPKSAPVESSETLITERVPSLNPRQLRLDLRGLLATCRLISLINDDYDGNAVDVLEENLSTPDFVVEKGNDALEYRAHMCLVRLASNGLMNQSQFRSLDDEKKLVATLNQESFGQRNWTAAHLRLGELQTLQALSGVAFGHVKEIQATLPEPLPPAYTIRDSSCPKEYMSALGRDD